LRTQEVSSPTELKLSVVLVPKMSVPTLVMMLT
jgi:hypothetical protein